MISLLRLRSADLTERSKEKRAGKEDSQQIRMTKCSTARPAAHTPLRK
jgi:hypothetical protein